MCNIKPKIAIVGVGLIGGSLGLAMKKRRLAAEITGIGRNKKRLQKAKTAGAIDVLSTEFSDAAEADIVILSGPVDVIPYAARKIKPYLKPSCIVTDTGSTKAVIVRKLENLFPGKFVGSHPLAGSEKSGVRFASPDLFEDATIILTPTEKTGAATLKKTRKFWTDLGGNVILLKPQEHDRFTADISHLPHLLAVGLVKFVLEMPYRKKLKKMIAGGFLDTTRIAAGTPEVWSGIFLTNKKEILRALNGMIRELEKLGQAIGHNPARLKRILRIVRSWRQRI